MSAPVWLWYCHLLLSEKILESSKAAVIFKNTIGKRQIKKVWVLALIEVIVSCLLVPGSQFREVGEKVRGGVEKVGQGKEKTFSEGNLVELLSG